MNTESKLTIQEDEGTIIFERDDGSVYKVGNLGKQSLFSIKIIIMEAFYAGRAGEEIKVIRE